MKAWDLDETKRHIRRLYGDEQLKLTISPLQSIGERPPCANMTCYTYPR